MFLFSMLSLSGVNMCSFVCKLYFETMADKLRPNISKQPEIAVNGLPISKNAQGQLHTQ